MITYTFFDSSRAEDFARYTGEKFTENSSLVPLGTEEIEERLDIRYGDRFMYFRFSGSLSNFSSELSVFMPKLKIFGNLIICIKANDSINISSVSSVYGEILDYLSSSAVSDFSLALKDEFGTEDKIEIEFVAKTFFGSDLKDSIVLQRLWEQVLSDSSCNFDKDTLESFKKVKPTFEYETIFVHLPPLSRMMLTMSMGAEDFKSLFSSYTGKEYNVIVE